MVDECKERKNRAIEKKKRWQTKEGEGEGERKERRH